jgi:hypothetical protein
MRLKFVLVFTVFVVAGCAEPEVEIRYLQADCGCDDEPQASRASVATDAARQSDSQMSGSEDAQISLPDASLEDAGPDIAESEQDGQASDVDEGDPQEVTEGSGVTEGSALSIHLSDLDGLLYYGLGVEPGTPLGSVGDTVVGAIVLPAIIQLTDDEFIIRVFDLAVYQAVDGPDGILESYPYEMLDEETIRVDFDEPLTSLEVQFWQNCVYKMDIFSLYEEPVYEDSLLTWSALELYVSQDCGNQGMQSSLGVNVHFLRKMDANPDYQPRVAPSDTSFGFFKISTDEETYLTRLPDITPDSEDGGVIYHVAHDFPEHLRPFVDNVFDAWNDVLEDTVGVRPFTVLDAPASLVPWDPRYRVVYWDESKSLGAVAPFLEDPLTGEMFDTDVIVWLSDVEDLIERYAEFFEEHPEVLDWTGGVGDSADEKTPPSWPYFEPSDFDSWHEDRLPTDWNEGRELPPRVLKRRAFERRPVHPLHVAQFMQTVGMSLTNDEIEAYILVDFLIHEVGHNLGLRHNFRGSMDHDHFEFIGDASASSTTTMDYVVGMTRPGSYDRDAMRMGYGAGPESDDYHYCTDEDVGLDPACAPWDYGHPVLFALGVLDAMVEEYPIDTATNAIEGASYEGEWNKHFNRIRQFFNTEHEQWDSELPVSTFAALLERVVCETPCVNHLYLRQQWALYLLYSKFVFNDDWQDFPPLTDEQATTLLDTYFTLVLDATQPLGLKETIIIKLPTSAVSGASELLDDLESTLASIEAPTEDEQTLLAWVLEAKAG